ncbi:MAG: hypothetical protein RMJ39_10365, partial [Deltaproteobacteria bacterium]|nr:hypothetical protein [Deltaproteobacteria bacterium]
EYDAHMQEKRYLLANQLLVPIPLGTFHMLNNAGLLSKTSTVIVVSVNYDSELGLLHHETAPDFFLI